MGRGPAIAALGVIVLGACNALSGASKLTFCDGDCPAPGGGPTDAAADAPEVVEAGQDGALPAACKDGQVTCAGKTAAQCVGGSWQAQDCPEMCEAGHCARLPSCRGAAADGCGTTSSSCCESGAVPASTFNRRNDTTLPASVSAFSLDRFEVTVARFRAFVAAGAATQANPPAAGAGANPKIPGSGWQAAWNAALPLDVAALTQSLMGDNNATWTAAPGANEHLPINLVSWPVAFAFCAWDGGRLPTYAEWEAAAAGGSEQRYYPWSTPPSAMTLDATPIEASYNCAYTPPTGIYGCAFNDIAPVGAIPGGEAKWGQRDLAGNMREWLLDFDLQLLPSQCNDCACLFDGPLNQGTVSCEGKTNNHPGQFLTVGGSWRDGGNQLQVAAQGQSARFDQVQDTLGFRCAR